MKKRGQARIIELILAIILIMLTSLYILPLYTPPERTKSPEWLKKEAQEILLTLDSDKTLTAQIYLQDIPAIKTMLNQAIPKELTYNFTVFDKNGKIIFNIIRKGYNPTQAASAIYIIPGWKGANNPRIVILSLSGE